MINKRYHTVGTIVKYNIKTVDLYPQHTTTRLVVLAWKIRYNQVRIKTKFRSSNKKPFLYISRRQTSRSHYGSKVPAVTITVFKYRNKIGKIVVKAVPYSVT